MCCNPITKLVLSNVFSFATYMKMFHAWCHPSSIPQGCRADILTARWYSVIHSTIVLFYSVFSDGLHLRSREVFYLLHCGEARSRGLNFNKLNFVAINIMRKWSEVFVTKGLWCGLLLNFVITKVNNFIEVQVWFNECKSPMNKIIHKSTILNEIYQYKIKFSFNFAQYTNLDYYLTCKFSFDYVEFHLPP